MNTPTVAPLYKSSSPPHDSGPHASGSKLSGGVIAGIVIAAVLVLGLLVVILYKLINRKKLYTTLRFDGDSADNPMVSAADESYHDSATDFSVDIEEDTSVMVTFEMDDGWNDCSPYSTEGGGHQTLGSADEDDIYEVQF